MLTLNYKTKKELKNAVGQRLQYNETSIFGAEYLQTGKITGCNQRRNWYATITMVEGKIKAVK